MQLQHCDMEVEKEKEAAAKEDFTKRTLKFVTSMKTRSTFYPADLMSPVFDKEVSDENTDAVTTKKKVSPEAAKNDLSGSSDSTRSSSTKKKRKGECAISEKSPSKKAKKGATKEVPISLFKK